MMAAAIGTASWHFLQNNVLSGWTAKPYSCTHTYSTEILSLDPLVVYINNFLSPYEVSRLLEIRLVFSVSMYFHY